MSINKVIGGIMPAFKSAVADKNVAGRTEITKYTLSTESLDSATKQTAVDGLGKLDKAFQTTIDTLVADGVLSKESFIPSQFEAAQKIAALAINPKEAFGAMANLKEPEVSGVVMSHEAKDLNIDDAVDAAVLSNEAYDGQAINDALYYSVAYNFGAARQDAFGEAFYPTLVMDPSKSGIAIDTEFTAIMSEVSRSISGAPDSAKFKKIPVAKAIYDNDLFSGDKNKVVPVLRTESEALMLKDYHVDDKSTLETITTAPLKAGETIGLLAISQSDAVLAKGGFDNTDTLDRTVNLERVYFNIGSVDGDGNPISEMFFANVNGFPTSNFTYSTQRHSKDISLAFATRSIILSTSDSLTAKSQASAILASMPANHTLRLEVKMSGDGNVETGDISVYGNVIRLAEVKDSNGDIVPETGAAYVAIKNAIKSLVIEGYTVEAYRTNSNMRTLGQIVSNDKYVDIYQVPLRSGVTAMGPVNAGSDTDNDVMKLAGQIKMAGIKTSIYAVRALMDQARLLKNITMNGSETDVELSGVSRFHTSPYYSEFTLDLSEYVDSIKSSERLEDIRSALLNRLKDEVLDMYTDSNYGVAYNTLMGNVGGKVGVIIGTDVKLGQYLSGGSKMIDLGDEFEARVVSTPNPLMKNKIVVTFGIFADDRNSRAYALNFGNCAWAPTISIDVNRAIGGATSRVVTNQPRFLHITHLNTMFVANVSNVASALGKIKALRQNV